MRSLNSSLVSLAVIVAASCSSAPTSSLAEDKHQISEITLERSGSWGIKSGYKVVFRQDATAEYLGDIHAKRKGKYRGNLSIDQFRQLTRLITTNDFFSLEDKYRASVKDTDTVTTSLVYSGGRKAVEDFGRGGGQRLTEIEQAIDSTAEQIVWLKDEG